jgi:hypothetical protein
MGRHGVGEERIFHFPFSISHFSLIISHLQILFRVCSCDFVDRVFADLKNDPRNHTNKHEIRLPVAPNWFAFSHESGDALIGILGFHQLMQVDVFDFCERGIHVAPASQVDCFFGCLERGS